MFLASLVRASFVCTRTSARPAMISPSNLTTIPENNPVEARTRHQIKKDRLEYRQDMRDAGISDESSDPDDETWSTISILTSSDCQENGPDEQADLLGCELHPPAGSGATQQDLVRLAAVPGHYSLNREAFLVGIYGQGI